MTDSPIRNIVASYSRPVIKAYSSVRFLILRQTFLEEIDQYLPKNGRILDLGCGFGLFSLFFASTQRTRRLVGVDLDAGRIAEAQASARKLGLDNVEYHCSDVLEWSSSNRFDAIYMLDVLHHLPQASVREFLERLRARLEPGGVLILKEVADRPLPKMLFTLALDRLMVGLDEPIHYWAPGELIDMVGDLGFDVKRHWMRDILPYPHILYVCNLGSG